jgi:hypothetical protein
MKLLMIFAVGYVVGARAGSDELEDIKGALRAIRESEEFDDLVAAVRTHVAHTLREVASMVDKVGPDPVGGQDLVDRVRLLVARD